MDMSLVLWLLDDDISVFHGEEIEAGLQLPVIGEAHVSKNRILEGATTDSLGDRLAVQRAQLIGRKGPELQRDRAQCHVLIRRVVKHFPRGFNKLFVDRIGSEGLYIGEVKVCAQDAVSSFPGN